MLIEKRGCLILSTGMSSGIIGRGTVFAFAECWERFLFRTGIKDMRFHDLRHTFASHFMMNGGDLYTLKEILGHKELDTITSV